MDAVKTSAGLTEKDVEKLEDAIFTKYDFVYDAFLDVVTKGIAVLDELKLAKKTVTAIEETSSKIKPPSVEIRGICELTCNQPNGVEIIKNAILDSIKDNESSITVTYIGAPKYRLSIQGSGF